MYSVLVSNIVFSTNQCCKKLTCNFGYSLHIYLIILIALPILNYIDSCNIFIFTVK